jgi:predicted NAD/FAD-dependent oxidoreductase
MGLAMTSKSAAVIGAGMAGISAAVRLRDTGWRVVVFEKSRGWGGRCATKRMEGCVVDHGAQYFTMRDAKFESAVRASCGEALPEIAAPVLDGSGAILETGAMFYHAEGNNRLARALGGGLEVRTGIELMEVRGRRIDGEDFDLVVCTAPWPQTAKLAGLDSAQNPYAPCLALILAYGAVWPGRTRECYAVRDADTPELAWTACENHKPGRIPEGTTVLVAHASEEFSRAFVEREPAEWSARMRRAVEELWEIPAEALKWSHPHRWRYARMVEKPTLPELPDRWVFAGDLLEASRVESAWLAGRKAVSAWV